MLPLPLHLDERGDLPVYVQIARALAADFTRGRLRVGDALPGARSLAGSLGVHRNTVVAAYAELEAQGWIALEQGRRPRVVAPLAGPPRRFAEQAELRTHTPDEVGFSLPRGEGELLPPRPRAPLALWGGVPDVRLLPRALIARAYHRRALRGGRDLWEYTPDPRGHPHLRRELSAMVSRTRGLVATADDVLVTRGSQMAIALLAELLLRPGDVVAVEDPGYAPAWAALRRTGAKLVPIRVDEDGLRVGDLAALLDRTPVRAVYVTPHHQYPTTVMLSPARRLELLELARRRRLAILEDDYDHEFHYEGRPALSLASADRHGVVVYIGSLSKILSPALRLGFVVAPPPLIARLAARRAVFDRQGDLVLEASIADMLEDGGIERHVRRTARVYKGRRDFLVARLDAVFGERLQVRTPAGGMALWARATFDVEAWQEKAESGGVFFQTARSFTFDGSAPNVARFGFALRNEAELRRAVAILASSAPPADRARSTRG